MIATLFFLTLLDAPARLSVCGSMCMQVSMQKDAKNLDGVEHREWHNLYGYYMQQATAMGLTQRSPPPTAAAPHPLRPFVLTRAFWAGSQVHRALFNSLSPVSPLSDLALDRPSSSSFSLVGQRFGAMWTGDNAAEWGHLKIAAPMLLSINLAGLSFAGADVGGFFGEPGPELFTRWYQAASFTPFFRGHAHHDTKRREPWVFGDPYTSILRDVAMVRYTLLPFWYSVFYEAYSTGLPVMRTLFSEFPDDAATFALDDQWMVGSALLVKPATDAGQTSVDVYLPADPATGTDGWYVRPSLSLLALSPGLLSLTSLTSLRHLAQVRPPHARADGAVAARATADGGRAAGQDPRIHPVGQDRPAQDAPAPLLQAHVLRPHHPRGASSRAPI